MWSNPVVGKSVSSVSKFILSRLWHLIYFWWVNIWLLQISSFWHNAGSAVAVECIFSGGRDTISLHHASLHANTIRILMLVKSQVHVVHAKSLTHCTKYIYILFTVFHHQRPQYNCAVAIDSPRNYLDRWLMAQPYRIQLSVTIKWTVYSPIHQTIKGVEELRPASSFCPKRAPVTITMLMDLNGVLSRTSGLGICVQAICLLSFFSQLCMANYSPLCNI